MTRVLLITDTARVQSIFQALEEKGVVQLKTASTLAQGETELAAADPVDFAFVQGRISGLSGDILLRHLDKILPERAKLVLMTGDADDAAKAKKRGKEVLDLSLDDQALGLATTALLTGPVSPPAVAGAPTATKPAAKKKKPDAPSAPKKSPAAATAKASPSTPKKSPATPRKSSAPKERPAALPEESPVAPLELAVAPQDLPVVPEVAPAVLEAPIATLEAPPAEPEEPPAVLQEPPAVLEEQPAVLEGSPVAPEEPPVAPEEQPAVVEEPPAVVEEPPAVAEEPSAEAAEMPEQEAEHLALEEPPASSEVNKKAVSFAEVMELAAARVEPLQMGMPEVEDRVEIGKGVAGGEETSAESAGSPDSEGKAETAMPEGVLLKGVPLGDALRHAEQKATHRPYRFIAPALGLMLVLILVPLISFQLGKKDAPPESEPPAPTKASKAPATAVPPSALPQAGQAVATPARTTPVPQPPPMQQPAPVAVPAPAPTPPKPAPAVAPAAPAPSTPKPEAKAPAAPQAKSELKPQPQAALKPVAKKPDAEQKKAEAKPAALQGVKALPPLLEGTRLDPEYGKSHPGWARYVGKKGEYKLFKEGEVYRAMQVLAVGGGTIPEDLFKRVLQEFGRIGSCRLDSRSAKGEYFIDQCVGKGNVAVTVYRNKSNLKVKGLVVYYTK